MKNKIIDPFRMRRGVNIVEKSKEEILSFFNEGVLIIMLDKKTTHEFLSHIEGSHKLYKIINKKYIADLFGDDVLYEEKNIRIVGFYQDNEYKINSLFNIIDRKKFHSNKRLIELVDLYYYSENYFDTVTLLK